MNNQPPTIPAALRVLTVRELTAAGLGSKPSIMRRVREGQFPAPFKIGGRLLWRETAIVAFLDGLSAG
jgi:predicted DNA-binding transcriptional regulator AlpA